MLIRRRFADDEKNGHEHIDPTTGQITLQHFDAAGVLYSSASPCRIARH